MFVKNYMTSGEIITTSEDLSLPQVAECMRGSRHHALPVVDDLQRVRGIQLDA